MKIVPSELTLADVCNQLQVTPGWVTKALGEFKMSRQGRGRARSFTQDELRIIRNLQLLRTCGLSWSQIREVQLLESKALSEIDAYLKAVRKASAKTEGPLTARHIQFLLIPAFSFESATFHFEGGKPSLSEDAMLQSIRAIVEKHKLPLVHEEMLRGLQVSELDLERRRKELIQAKEDASGFHCVREADE